MLNIVSFTVFTLTASVNSSWKSTEKVIYVWKIKLSSTMIFANSVSFLTSTDDRIQKFSSMSVAFRGQSIGEFSLVYSCFEKSCRKKCTRQSRKVLWVVLSSLFFKEIWKNGTRGHGGMFARAKGKQQKQVRQLQCQEQCVDHIPYYLSGLSGALFSDNLSRNSCIHTQWSWWFKQSDWFAISDYDVIFVTLGGEYYTPISQRGGE